MILNIKIIAKKKKKNIYNFQINVQYLTEFPNVGVHLTFFTILTQYKMNYKLN